MTRIGAGLSTAPDAAHAAGEAAREAGAAVGGAEVDLAFLFVSPPHLEQVEEAAEAARRELSPRHLLGCVAEGVVGREREVEDGPAAAVWAASLPGATIAPFHATALQAGEAVVVTGFPRGEGASLVAVLADPFTFPTVPLLARVGAESPGLPLAGGIAAGAGQPGTQALVDDTGIHQEGAVGVVLGSLPVRTVVSQGCAPIGRDAVVTSAEGNVVYELAGKPALERLQEEIAALPVEERLLAAQGVLAGLVVDENLPEYGPGDYLVRALVGVDEETGALAVGDQVRIGQTLRFHVRDAASADRDLRERLSGGLQGARPAGALLFTCNGRGAQMFGEPDHDARAVARALGTDAVAGFFCGGEIGPVGGRPFLHGFTATTAVFLER